MKKGGTEECKRRNGEKYIIRGEGKGEGRREMEVGE